MVYDEQGQLIGEYNNTAGMLREIVWLQDIPVAVMTPSGTATNLSYIDSDHLNTPRTITNQSKQKRWEWNSDPFGSTLANENPTALGAFTFNLRFPGQYFDKETGLHYNYFRDYNPQVGRYIQSDPIGLRGSLNTYAYVSGNPVGWIDPFGLIDLKIPGATGELAVRANPGRDVVGDPSAIAEHPPAHVHLGNNEGPRVRLTDFEHYSEKDAKLLSPKQRAFCKSLSNQQKNLVRKRAKSVYKRGGFFLRLPDRRIVPSAVKGGLLGLTATYVEEMSPGLACEVDPEFEICSE